MNYLSLDKSWYTVNSKALNIESPQLQMEVFTLDTCRLETLPIGKAQTVSRNAEEAANTNTPTCSVWTGYGQTSEPNADIFLGIPYQSIILDGLLKLCVALFYSEKKCNIIKKIFKKGKSPAGPQADMAHEH